MVKIDDGGALELMNSLLEPGYIPQAQTSCTSRVGSTDPVEDSLCSDVRWALGWSQQARATQSA